MSRYLRPAIATLALRTLAALALALAWLAPGVWAPRTATETVVLVDRSRSVPAAAADAAWRTVLDTRGAARGRSVTSLAFAGAVAPAGATAGDAGLELGATDIERALDAGLRTLQPGTPGELVVVSDGHSTRGTPERPLAAARAAGIPVYWLPVMRAPPAARVASVTAPDSVVAGQSVPLTIAIERAAALGVDVVAATADGQEVRTRLDGGPGATRAQLALRAPAAGPLAISVQLLDADSGAVIEPSRPAALVEVRGRTSVLYLARGPAPFAASLAVADYDVDRRTADRAPETVAALRRYAAVVLDDVPIAAAPESVWAALASAVRDDGLGLVVLGGPNAFAAGGYRDSTLESVLPVRSEPSPEDPGAAFAFVVDKSGSMGRGSDGVDRLSVARAAVIETARELAPRDELALLAFDVAPRVLLPLVDAGQAQRALAAPWPVVASGGTRIAPALEAAAATLGAARSRRRIAVIVTDGFVGAESLDAAQRTLAAAGVELVVLAVGADADVAALGALSTRLHGELLRVGAVAELPTLMRGSVTRRLGRIVPGPVATRLRLAPPFLAAVSDWPSVGAYARVRPQPGAAVYLETQSGDPLLATRQAGAGRSVALAAGLGAWTPRWFGWTEWPAFAGGLLDWVSRGSGERSIALRVAVAGPTLVVEADVADGNAWSALPAVDVAVRAPSGRMVTAVAQPGTPGRYATTIAAPESGLYVVTALAAGARAERTLLVPASAEDDAYGASPQLAEWRQLGLVREWPPPHGATAAGAAADLPRGRARLAVAGLGLFLAALLIDSRGVWIRIAGRRRAPR